MDVEPWTAVITPAIVVVFDHGRVRVVYTFGDARTIVADLIADPLGIGCLGEHKPQCGCDDAKEYLAHSNSSPGPFAPIIAAAALWFRKRPVLLA
jgi:hypothetical protein